MSLEVSFFHSGSAVVLRIDPQSPVSSIFDMVKDAFQLKNPPEDYCLLHSFKKIDINETTFAEAFGELGDINEIHIGLKNEIAIIDSFCEKHAASLKYEAIMMDSRIVDFLKDLYSLHKKIIRMYESQIDFTTIVPKEVAVGEDIDLLKNITKWFTEQFMQWQEAPQCDYCSTTMEFTCFAQPRSADKVLGADKARKYTCQSCNAAKRIPQYEIVESILNTRKGQSSEYSILLGSILRFFGFEIRIVKEALLHHYWLEAFCNNLGRFVSVDPVSGFVDAPLQLEVGNSAQITRVLAAGVYECVDVTPRYTMNIEYVIYRRDKEVPEEYFQQIINMRNSMWSYGISPQLKEMVKSRKHQDYLDLAPRDKEPSTIERTPSKHIDSADKQPPKRTTIRHDFFF